MPPPPQDITKPVITLNGSNPTIIPFNGTYTELGATCVDETDGALPTGITGKVNAQAAGDHTVTYECADSAGNLETATRIVTVQEPIVADAPATSDDTQPAHAADPNLILAVKGYAAENHGAEHVERWNRVLAAFGVTEHDNPMTAAEARHMAEKFMSSRWNPVVDEIERLESVAASDDGSSSSSSNGHDDKISEPVPDTTPPIIVLHGISPVHLTVGDKYADAGATCTDETDGTLSVTSDASAVSTQTAGNHTITYGCADSAGNLETATRIVTVQEPIVADAPATSDDTQPAHAADPNLILAVKGYAAENHGAEHVERWNRVLAAFGVTEHDNPMTAAEARHMAEKFMSSRWNPVVDEIERLESVAASDDGSSSSSSNGHDDKISEPVPDTTPPIIVLHGISPVHLTVGDKYADAGATCTDETDGTLSVTSDASAVSTQTAGNHTITYGCADSSGNSAHAVTRTIVVKAPAPITQTDTSHNDTQLSVHAVDPNLIQKVRKYAAETHHGAEHVDRWYRVLGTFDAITAMTVEEAQSYADRGWGRWDPVVSELQNTVAPQAVIDDVKKYAAEAQHGAEHVDRWYRVLGTFDAITAMTVEEAQSYADRGWGRWDPVVEALKALQ